MKILKKAWIVYHEGMIGEGVDLYQDKSEIEPVYADTIGEAKKDGGACYDYPNKDGEDISFIEIRAVRNKGADKVLLADFEGQGITRNTAEYLLKEKKRISDRIEKINRFPVNAKFYIQNGYVGNSVLWWALKGSGYTSDITKAQIYTHDEILDKFRTGGREEDRIWESTHVMQNIKQHVDSQYLKPEFQA